MVKKKKKVVAPKTVNKNGETYMVLIKHKSQKDVVKHFNLPFENAFDAIAWGEKQAEAFGDGFFAELGKKS